MVIKKLVFIIFLFLLLIVIDSSLLVARSFAFTFSSSNYIIDWGNFNITSGRKNSTHYSLSDTVGQNAPGQYLAPTGGFRLKSGFQYIYDTIYPFSFAINNLSIDFGTLTPQLGTTAVGTLSVSSPAGHGYQIMAFENHPLRSQVGNTIPDTRGDNNLATESVSDIWTQNTTTGFGFHASGHGTASYFSTSNHFRQFADFTRGESAQILASESTPQRDRSQTITYKVNVSPIQSAGNYQTSITFIAVPKY